MMKKRIRDNGNQMVIGVSRSLYRSRDKELKATLAPLKSQNIRQPKDKQPLPGKWTSALKGAWKRAGYNMAQFSGCVKLQL